MTYGLQYKVGWQRALRQIEVALGFGEGPGFARPMLSPRLPQFLVQKGICGNQIVLERLMKLAERFTGANKLPQKSGSYLDAVTLWHGSLRDGYSGIEATSKFLCRSN
jgi:hypothetical protein